MANKSSSTRSNRINNRSSSSGSSAQYKCLRDEHTYEYYENAVEDATDAVIDCCFRESVMLQSVAYDQCCYKKYVQQNKRETTIICGCL